MTVAKPPDPHVLAKSTRPIPHPGPGSSERTQGGPDRPDLFWIGEILDETYEIRCLLGQGGMGQVYEALDRLLHRIVAIKAAWPSQSRPDQEPRSVRREAEALAAVRHPSMVAVHHLGVHRTIEYVVMERIYGVSLADHMSRRRAAGHAFTLDETLDVLIALAEGLRAVHRAGLAHRDVKPGNVMLAPGHRVVLMDFGIALPEFDHPVSGAPSGSPDYMAPESILSDARPGGRFLVDVYALGVIAFEMLTGKLPYTGNDVMEVWAGHLAAPVPDPREIRAEIPAQLAEMILAMLAKDSSARPQSVETIALSLRALRAPTQLGARERAFSVIVVDDDEDMADLVRLIVKQTIPTASIRTAPDAEHAIAMVHEAPPDVLLLDLALPRMNGVELAMYLRGTHMADGTTIVSLSATASATDLQLLRQLGVTRFVAKGGSLEAHLSSILREVRDARG